MVFEGKTILVAPLDWGLGHASRCVPLIRQFSEKNTVIIGATHLTAPLLGSYFPNLQQVEFSSYSFKYSKHGPQWFRALWRLPWMLQTISKEKKETERYVRRYGINMILSDNRYGVYHPAATNIFVCHQVRLHLPVFSGLLSRFHQRWIRQFSEIWIPDYADPKKRLAGELSDSSFLRVKHAYIGPLSALSGGGAQYKKEYDYLLLLSGPEPQRTLLEEKLLRKMKGKKKRVALVRGTPFPSSHVMGADFVKDLCTGDELSRLIKVSEVIICRSGYSTLMDLHELDKKKIILIPTPGQPEQEYLAKHWNERFGARVIEQRKIETIEF